MVVADDHSTAPRAAIASGALEPHAGDPTLQPHHPQPPTTTLRPAAEPHLAQPARRSLICGPSGGGKSRWAEHLAACAGRPVAYLATGPLLPEDDDWQRRLERHRRRRPASWRCLEVGGDLVEGLAGLTASEVGLIDSLGTWVAAWLSSGDADWLARCRQLLAGWRRCEAALLLVGEEVGWGVVPATPEGHRFQSRLTALQLQLAADCDAHWLVVGGRALDLLSLGLQVPGEEL